MKRCPTCHQPIVKGPRRKCADCQQAIGLHHKWHFGEDSKPVHNDCQNPTSYGYAEETAPLLEQEER